MWWQTHDREVLRRINLRIKDTVRDGNDGTGWLERSKVSHTDAGARGAQMRTMSYTESRARYAEVLDAVVNDNEEVVITRAGREPVVIVSLAEYGALRESAYLVRSPVNAHRLLDAMERLEAGEGEQHDLDTAE